MQSCHKFSTWRKIENYTSRHELGLGFCVRFASVLHSSGIAHFILLLYSCTMEPRYNEPLYNKVLRYNE